MSGFDDNYMKQHKNIGVVIVTIIIFLFSILNSQYSSNCPLGDHLASPPLLEIVTLIKCQQASVYVTLTAAGGGINSPVCLSCKFNEFISKFHQRSPVGYYRIQITFGGGCFNLFPSLNHASIPSNIPNLGFSFIEC